MATTQLLIHFERLLRINIEIPFGVLFSRYPSVVFKEYICAIMGDSQSCILKLTFPRNALACKTVPESIVGRYPLLWEFAILVWSF